MPAKGSNVKSKDRKLANPVVCAARSFSLLTASYLSQSYSLMLAPTRVYLWLVLTYQLLPGPAFPTRAALIKVRWLQRPARSAEGR